MKSINVFPSNSLSLVSDSINQMPILICPYCQKNIPQLSLQGSNRQMNVYLNCSCMKDTSFISLNHLIEKMNQPNQHNYNYQYCKAHYKPIEKYCEKCSIWLCSDCLIFHRTFAKKHSLLNHELSIHCRQHEEAFSHYCEECNTNLCSECLYDHVSHQVINLTSVEFTSIELNIIDSLIAQNKQSTDALLRRIDFKINRLMRMKEEIQSAFNINNSINQSLRKLYHSLCSTSLICQNYPLYQIMQLKLSIKINNKQIEEGKSIEDSFIKLNDYFKKNHVLIQSNTNECRATLIGHRSYVSCLCQLNDGRLVSGSSDTSIKVWEPMTFQCITTLHGHDDYVCSLYQLNDDLLASGSSDKSVKLWHPKTFECMMTLIGHEDYVNFIMQLNDGYLASCSDDMTIKIWDYMTKECLSTLNGHLNSVLCLVQLNDGRIASGSRDKTIKLWDSNETECITTLTGHSNIVSCLVLLIDGRLASGSLDKSIKIWNPFTLKCVATLLGHNNYVSCLVQLYNGRLASGSWDKTIKSWNTTTNGCKGTLTGHSNNISCIIQLHDGRLASGCDDETIKFWST